MFRKYKKTYHLTKDSGSKILSSYDLQRLFASDVVVEEKIDGANAGIVRTKKHFKLQKRGSLVGQSEHEQWNFFHNWAYLNWKSIMEIPIGWTVYGEWMAAVHTIYYDKLPDYFLIFDVWNGEEYLGFDERQSFCEDRGFTPVPWIMRGSLTKEDVLDIIPEESAFGDIAEGVVVKPEKRNKGLRAKFVKEWFHEAMFDSDHWSRKKMEWNHLAENAPLREKL